MRLINTDTLEMGEFYEPKVPVYAILSHTWEKDELTLREWTEPSTATTAKAGYKKVCMAASLARRSGFAWLWVDTVCIDKTSSAELSEAINSMFNWYSEAHICYAFLADVSKDSLAEAADHAPENGEEGLNLSQFRNSRWFTRGWTLQELIAPRQLVFYSREWARLGTKASFASHISRITGIETSYLGPTKLAPFLLTSAALGASVATRMSWLAKRQTTRIEDMAYCMLGIFDINMPLLYGEGHKAFLRLQEEIIRVHNDHSIFTWHSVADKTSQNLVPEDGSIGFLATTPRAFECAKPATPFWITSVPSPYTMTNAGLSITMPLVHTVSGYIVILSASQPGYHARLGVYVRRNGVGEIMSRVISPARPLRVCLDPSKFEMTRIYLRAVDRRRQQPLRYPVSPTPRNCHGLLVSLRQSMEVHAPKFYTLPDGSLRSGDRESDTLIFPAAHGHPGFVAINEASGVRAVTTGVVLGAAPSWGPDGVPLTSWLNFSLLFTQTAIHNLQTESVDYHYAALALGTFSRHSRVLWWAFASSPETRTAVSKLIREENAMVLSKYVYVQRQTRPGLYAMSNPGRDCRFEGGCDEYVEFGCCDMDHPDFDQLRLVRIGWPPASTTGETPTPIH